LFAAINGWTPTNFFGGDVLVFICKESLELQHIYNDNGTTGEPGPLSFVWF
jgi:hypothetical protein